jgi:hypothetical protein
MIVSADALLDTSTTRVLGRDDSVLMHMLDGHIALALTLQHPELVLINQARCPKRAQP